MSYSSVILADNPTAYYRMNETSGSIVHDLSGNSYDGNLSGIFTLAQRGAIINDSDFSTAMDGGTGVVSLPWSDINITSWTTFSLEFWIELSNVWEYVAITWDGTTTTVYRNGYVYTPDPTAPTEIDQSFYWAGSSLSGNLDEIAVYHASLMPIQIAAHYQAGITFVPNILFHIPIGAIRCRIPSGTITSTLSSGTIDLEIPSGTIDLHIPSGTILLKERNS